MIQTYERRLERIEAIKKPQEKSIVIISHKTWLNIEKGEIPRPKCRTLLIRHPAADEEISKIERDSLERYER